MARGGQNRKSKAQAEMDGTFKPSRHVDPVEIAPGAIEAPSSLGDAARDVWERYIQPRAGLGFYEPAEVPMLAAWCVMYVRLLAADAATPFAGLMEAHNEFTGEVVFKKHPGVAVLAQMSAEFRALSARLGLDPLARMALADLGKGGGAKGPQLPEGAPAAFVPKVVKNGKTA